MGRKRSSKRKGSPLSTPLDPKRSRIDGSASSRSSPASMAKHGSPERLNDTSEPDLFVESEVDDSVQSDEEAQRAVDPPRTPTHAQFRTPPRVPLTARKKSQNSPQKVRQAGFAEPMSQPTRQFYKPPRFKRGQVPQPIFPAEKPSSYVGATEDMDEGAAGLSSDLSDSSDIVRRIAVEKTVEARDTSRKNTFGRELSIQDVTEFDGSVIPDSQAENVSTIGSRPVLEPPQDPPTGNSALVPAETVLNTTTEISMGSPPSVLTAASQESSTFSRKRLICWLQHSEELQPHSLGDFIRKHSSSTATDSQPCVRDCLSSYMVGQKLQVDGPKEMQKWHKGFASDPNMSIEQFLRRLLYEMRARQKSLQIETEILYGPWRALAETFGRPVVVFTLLYTNVYKPLGGPQWLQISGDVPRYQPSRQQSVFQQNAIPYVTKRDIVFREFNSNQPLRLPALTSAMHRSLPEELKSLIKTVEARSRPMRFLFDQVPVNKEGWTPRKRVARFLSLCMKKVFPRKMLGSAFNDQALEHTVRMFVNMPASGKMPLGQAAHGIKLRDIEWTGAIKGSEAAKAGTMLLFWDWLFNHFLKPMLAHHFYMTEMSGKPASLYYYELSVWSRKVKMPGLASLVNQQGGKDQLVAGQNGERLRFVPKQSGGVRPIVNLREFNKSLKLAHAVLQSLPQSSTRLKSWQDWFLKLDAFREQHKEIGSKFYAVKFDISGCYDNMNKQKLEQIVRRHLSNGSKEFWLHTSSFYDTYARAIKERTSAIDASDIYANVSGASSLSPPKGDDCQKRNPQIHFSKAAGNYQFQGSRLPPEKRLLHGLAYDGHEVLDDLTRLIHDLKLQVSRSKVMPFKTGIPQGSSCSLDLCNLLLDDLVHKKLKDFIASPQCLLMRYVDDFLLVTTSRAMAECFHAKMLHGFSEEYGVTSKAEKQLSNLSGSVRKMEYLGYEFDPGSLEIFPRKVRTADSSAPVPVFRSAVVQRAHINLETILGILRTYKRTGIQAPTSLEKRVSRSFGTYVADRLDACRALLNEHPSANLFRKLVRIKLLPLVSADHRTSMMKAAENMYQIRLQRRRASQIAQSKQTSNTT